MSEPEHDDPPDEAAGAPVSPETVVDDGQAEDEAETAENGAGEAVEGETADDDDDAAEREQQTASEQRASEKDVEKMFKAFAAEHTRHTRRIAEIAGADAPDLIECPACKADQGQPQLAGWLLPVPISEDKAIALRALIGLPEAPELQPDPYSRPCDTCGGLGVVDSRSHAPNQGVLTCIDCGAKGWVATGPERGGVAASVVNGGSEHAPEFVPAAAGPETPEVAALRAQGYTIIPPLNVNIG